MATSGSVFSISRYRSEAFTPKPPRRRSTPKCRGSSARPITPPVEFSRNDAIGSKPSPAGCSKWKSWRATNCAPSSASRRRQFRKRLPCAASSSDPEPPRDHHRHQLHPHHQADSHGPASSIPEQSRQERAETSTGVVEERIQADRQTPVANGDGADVAAGCRLVFVLLLRRWK